VTLKSTVQFLFISLDQATVLIPRINTVSSTILCIRIEQRVFFHGQCVEGI
jgi:hypothetical protein